MAARQSHLSSNPFLPHWSVGKEAWTDALWSRSLSFPSSMADLCSPGPGFQRFCQLSKELSCLWLMKRTEANRSLSLIWCSLKQINCMSLEESEACFTPMSSTDIPKIKGVFYLSLRFNSPFFGKFSRPKQDTKPWSFKISPNPYSLWTNYNNIWAKISKNIVHITPQCPGFVFTVLVNITPLCIIIKSLCIFAASIKVHWIMIAIITVSVLYFSITSIFTFTFYML